ncbi:hypothetical protein Pen02_25180 [Plantactinospora endophytica]|uniref:Uncharacterized protein n=1 Tax=Plantactinospora endophytica TaxID=673535 RepID=A0ABQ4DYS4_9ACTN|nr:hypothetical protein Pen02_25180 [Plantactinospora endophytica]
MSGRDDPSARTRERSASSAALPAGSSAPTTVTTSPTRCGTCPATATHPPTLPRLSVFGHPALRYGATEGVPRDFFGAVPEDTFLGAVP